MFSSFFVDIHVMYFLKDKKLKTNGWCQSENIMGYQKMVIVCLSFYLVLIINFFYWKSQKDYLGPKGNLLKWWRWCVFEHIKLILLSMASVEVGFLVLFWWDYDVVVFWVFGFFLNFDRQVIRAQHVLLCHSFL